MFRGVKLRRFFLLALLALPALPRAACAEEKLRVSSFSTILTELAEQVGATGWR